MADKKRNLHQSCKSLIQVAFYFALTHVRIEKQAYDEQGFY